MRLLATFTVNSTKKRLAIKPFDVREVNQLTASITAITYATWESDDFATRTVEVVGCFEDVVAKLEAAD